MIIAVADVSAFGETDEMVDFASEAVLIGWKKHESGWIVIGNVIAATSEKQLDKAIRGLPVNRLGDGLL